MSWFEDPNCEAASLAENSVVAYGTDFDFLSGHVQLTTWPGSLTIGGNTYLGLGTLGSIAEVEDRAQLTTERWTYGLSGVDPSVVPESEIDNSYGRSATEYEVWLNPETHAVIGFETNREGTMDRVRRSRGGIPSIEIDCESRLVILEQADGWMYTLEHSAEFFAGDTGCNQVKELESVEIIWGGKRVEAGVVGTLAGRVLTKKP